EPRPPLAAQRRHAGFGLRLEGDAAGRVPLSALFRQHAPLPDRAYPARGLSGEAHRREGQAPRARLVQIYKLGTSDGRDPRPPGRRLADAAVPRARGPQGDLSMTGHLLSSVTADRIWLVLGFAGQALFASRFLVQWFRSEMEGRSVVPLAFWYFS